MKASIIILVLGFAVQFISTELQFAHAELSTFISISGAGAIYLGLLSIFAHLIIPD